MMALALAPHFEEGGATARQRLGGHGIRLRRSNPAPVALWARGRGVLRRGASAEQGVRDRVANNYAIFDGVDGASSPNEPGVPGGDASL